MESKKGPGCLFTTPWRATHSVLDNSETQEEKYLSFEFQRHWCDCKGCKRRKVFGEINIIKAHCGCTRGQQETFFHTAACLSPRTHKAIILDPYFYLPRAVCAVCVQPLFEICLGLKVAQVVRRPKRVSAQEDNLCFMLS